MGTTSKYPLLGLCNKSHSLIGHELVVSAYHGFWDTIGASSEFELQQYDDKVLGLI